MLMNRKPCVSHWGSDHCSSRAKMSMKLKIKKERCRDDLSPTQRRAKQRCNKVFFSFNKTVFSRSCPPPRPSSSGSHTTRPPGLLQPLLVEPARSELALHPGRRRSRCLAWQQSWKSLLKKSCDP